MNTISAVLPRRKTVNDLPTHLIAVMGVKLYLLGSLAWDYAETVREVAITIGDTRTKRLCRAVRELHYDYDRTRQYLLDAEHIAAESKLALLFESICSPILNNLSSELSAESNVIGLNADYAVLVKAVQMALAVTGAMEVYARRCDQWLRRQGVKGHSILDDRFRRLSILIPGFAGDCYNAHSPARIKATTALVKELLALELCDDTDTFSDTTLSAQAMPHKETAV